MTGTGQPSTCWGEGMPIRWYDGFHRDESIGMAVLQLLTVGGIPDLTMRAVARAARLALGTLGNHYGSKEQMLMGAAGAIGHLHVTDICTRAYAPTTLSGVLGSMSPRDREELTELKVWLDLTALGRSSAGIGEVVAGVEERHRALLRRQLRMDRDGVWADRHLDGVWAILQGIRSELVRPGSTLDLTTATDLCSRAADAAEVLAGTTEVRS